MTKRTLCTIVRYSDSASEKPRVSRGSVSRRTEKITSNGRAAILCALALWGVSGAGAATISYDGGPSGAGVDWSTAENWSGDALPSSTDTAAFQLATSMTISLGEPRTVYQLYFNSANNNVTLGSASDISSGNSITTSHVRRDSSTGGTQTIATNVVLGTTTSIWDVNAGFNNHLLVTGGISGTGSLVKVGNGTLMLAGANTYSGGTVINAGTVNLNFGAGAAPTANILLGTSSLSFSNGGGTLSLTGRNGVSVSQSFASTIVSSGQGALSIANGNTANTRTLLNLGAITRNGGGTLILTQPTGTGNTTVGATNGYATTTGNDASGILGAYAVVNNAGTLDWATNNGTNIVSYTGYLDLAGAGPALADSPTSNIRITNGSTGDVGQGAGTTTVNTIRVNDAAARLITVGSGNTLRLGASGGILSTGTGGLTIGAPGNAGALTAGGTDDTAGDIVLHNSTVLTVNSVIVDNGTGAVSLTKTGSGAATLTGLNTYTGGTYVNQGTLALAAGTDRLAAAGNITLNGGALDLATSTQNLSGDLVINGGTLSNGTILKSGTDYQANAGTITAVLGGSVGLTKTGAGTLSLNANNTYTGTTTILEGRLNATVAGATKGNIVVGSVGGGYEAVFSGSGVNAVADSASATIYQNGSFSLGNGDNMNSVTIVGGRFTSNNGYVNGTITLTGGSIGSGGIFGNVASITTNASDTTAIIAGSLSGGAGTKTFTVNDGTADVDLRMTGNITAGTSVTKSGAGTMALIGAKNYRGVTTLNAGTLIIDTLANGGSASSLGTSSNAASSLLLRNGTTLQYAGAGGSTDRLFTVGTSSAGQSATIDSSGTGAMSFTNTGAIAYGTTNQTRTLVLSGTNSGNNSLSPAIGNNGTGAVSVTKNGSGKWILAGSNTYTGATNVNAGTLVVNGSLGASAVTVANGATLGGSGSIAGNTVVQSGGSLSPGNSPGILTETGNLTLETGANFLFELNANTDLLADRGTLFDGVDVSGSGVLSIQTGVTANLVFNGSGSSVDFTSAFWDAEHQWLVFDNANPATLDSASIFDAIAAGQDSLGNNFSVTGGSFSFVLSGADIYLSYATVPEPSTSLIILMGIGALVVLRRRTSRAIA